jgi:ribosomal protein L11 methyltransferase
MDQTWTQVDIYTTTQGLEPLGAALMDIGHPAFAIRDAADFESFLAGKQGRWDYVDDALLSLREAETAVTVYLPDNQQGADGLIAIREMLTRLQAMDTDSEWGRLTYELSGVREEDWATAWKKYFHPVPVGQKLLICPSWEEAPNDGRLVMRLDPGMAFGTGTHETTRLCLELLESHIHGGEDVLDMGCGSGILSIGALLLGAKRAVGVDIDEVAVRVAAENAAINGVESKASFLCGDLADKVTGDFDVICANIVADVILRFAPLVPGFLRPGGVFVVSGIIEPREAEVREALEALGFCQTARLESGGWVCLALTRSS